MHDIYIKRHKNKWSRIEDLEVNPCVCKSTDLQQKVLRACIGEKTVSSTNGGGKIA
jgi:hypothetical protein